MKDKLYVYNVCYIMQGGYGSIKLGFKQKKSERKLKDIIEVEKQIESYKKLDSYVNVVSMTYLGKTTVEEFNIFFKKVGD